MLDNVWQLGLIKITKDKMVCGFMEYARNNCGDIAFGCRNPIDLESLSGFKDPEGKLKFLKYALSTTLSS